MWTSPTTVPFDQIGSKWNCRGNVRACGAVVWGNVGGRQKKTLLFVSQVETMRSTEFFFFVVVGGGHTEGF